MKARGLYMAEVYSSPERFSSMLSKAVAEYANIIKTAGIPPQ